MNARVEDPAFWNDAEAAQTLMRERTHLATQVEAVRKLNARGIGASLDPREDKSSARKDQWSARSEPPPPPSFVSSPFDLQRSLMIQSRRRASLFGRGNASE